MRRIFTLVTFLLLPYLASFAQISGTVFRDYNADGIQQTAGLNIEPGAAGIIVNAYDATNTVIATTTSAANGTYSLPYTVPVRVEFEIPVGTVCANAWYDFSGIAANGNSVRFISGNMANVDYAIQNPSQFVSNANPDVFVARFNRGDPLSGGTSATALAFMGHPYQSATSVVSTWQLNASFVGSVWGVAYSKHAHKIFTAAFLKRHSGLGPLGSGGIYMLEPTGSTFNVTNFYDMDANGHRTRAASTAVPHGLGSSYNVNGTGTQATWLGPIDPLTGLPEGFGVVGVNGAGGRGMSNLTTGQWNDPTAFDQVCKVGLGDIDISEDGKFLFVMNLYDRSLYRLELDNVLNPQSVIAVTSYPLPAVPVNNGVLRGFAIGMHRGKVYVGAVSTGENGGQNVLNGATDMYAFVFELNDPSGTPVFNATPVVTFPLNYQKGYSISGVPGANEWHPWTDNTSTLITISEETYPCPVLSDIGFSDRGDLIMDFMDRSGHQYAGNSRKDLTGQNMVGSYDIGGDLVIAGIDCNTGIFTLENNGTFTSLGTPYPSAMGIGNGEGIGGGEFFEGDHWIGLHYETSVGSLAVLPGLNEFIATVMDPVNAFSNGTGRFSTTNGSASGHCDLAAYSEFGKANSMGDIETTGDAPNTQIGNRIWADDDADGIQDPGEAGINNVSIELFADFNLDNVPDGAALASVASNSNGEWYFDATNVPDGDPLAPGAQPGPAPFRNYLARVTAANWSGSQGVNQLYGHTISPPHVGGAGQPDVRDNDAILISSLPTIAIQMGQSGKNDHSQDFGFIPCVPVPLNDVILDCITTMSPIGPTPQGNDTYLWAPPAGLSATNVAQPDASPSSTTIYTLTINGACQQTMTVFVDVTPPPANAGPLKELDCKTTSVQIGTPGQPGYTYHWEPADRLDDANAAQPMASPVVTTTYTLTVTGANGCTSQSTTTVSLNECCTRLVVPNSFTPNGDLNNDKFGIIEVENVQSFVLSVYNRFGEKVFETDQKDFKWDGMYKGKVADVGTYFYMIIYDCKNGGAKKMLKGDVTLLR
ncbi:MAG: gliding motility-associated C-terminal domain-containing protein [Chitinophagaceae bacterium]|nr:gliding motility-associated C-terminal domain-containing protein [Chitinophagaceae bacterium]